MFHYRDIPFSDVSTIKCLWEKNREYHERLSKNFGGMYSNLIFEERINNFGAFDKDHIKITIAENSQDKEILGYCISTFNGVEGETHSLHVYDGVRGCGIGKSLMSSHIEWMKNNGCTNITITVAFENKNTIQFYRSLGFKENTIEMQL